MKKILLLTITLISISVCSQTDEKVLKKIYKQSLTNGKSYDWLNHLSNQIGSRLSGSLGAKKAVTYTKEELDKLGLDKVWLQSVMVPRWIRGAKEFAFIETNPGKTTTVNICALGGSVATPALGIKADIIEVKNFEELEKFGNPNQQRPTSSKRELSVRLQAKPEALGILITLMATLPLNFVFAK